MSAALAFCEMRESWTWARKSQETVVRPTIAQDHPKDRRESQVDSQTEGCNKRMDSETDSHFPKP